MTHWTHRNFSLASPCILLVVCLLLATTANPQVMGVGWHIAKLMLQSEPNTLDRVLTQMDNAAKTFRTAQASLTAEQYTKVVDEKETQKGKVYFERHGSDVSMAADITEPDKQFALYANGKAQIYHPKIDQVDEYQPGKSKGQIEAFLLLGFGGGGHVLLSSYDVKYLGTENVNGVNAPKLELTPKSQQLQNNISKIILWIDPVKGVAVQMQLFFPGGDYRLTKYSDIQIHQKLPDNAFKLKTTGKTRFVSPQG
jgi:outer membrane lipoprotein-sorting protein